MTEAMTAADKLQARGISCGVILLETLKPYAAAADRIAALLPSAWGGGRFSGGRD